MDGNETIYCIFRDSIVVHTGDRTHTIAKSDPRYNEIVLNVLAKRLDRLADLLGNADQKALSKLLGLGDRK
jgi:hypothetical protein